MRYVQLGFVTALVGGVLYILFLIFDAMKQDIEN